MVPVGEGSIRNVLLACCSFFLLCLSAYVIMPLIPLLVKSRTSIVNVAWITVGASVLGVIPASIIGGRISDYIGQKATIVAALLIFGFSKFLFPYSTTLALLFILRAIGGLYAAAFPATQSILTTAATSPQERTKFLGYYGFAFGAGLSIGPILGGFIGQHWGLAEAFNFTLYFSLLGAFLILFVKEERKERSNQRLLIISKNPVFWQASLSAFLCMGVMGTLLTLLPIIGSGLHRLSNQSVGLTMALLTGCFAISQLVLGTRLKADSLLTTIQKGFGILIVGLSILYVFEAKTFGLLIGLLFTGVGLGAAYVAATSMAAGTTTPETRGGIMGIFTASMNLGYGLLAVTVVYLASLREVKNAFLILIVVIGLVLAVLSYTNSTRDSSREDLCEKSGS